MRTISQLSRNADAVNIATINTLILLKKSLALIHYGGLADTHQQRRSTMDKHTGVLYIKRAGAYQRYTKSGADILAMEESIKGRDELIAQMKGEMIALQTKVTQQDNCIAQWKSDIAIQTK
jgi:hypothetical protein